MDSAIILDKLSKRYAGDEYLALNKVSLTVNKGEVYGFLGANGAGKSTTIRTLLNFIQPTSGSATVCGYDIVDQAVDVKKHIGYLAGEVALYNKMTGRQFLRYMAELQPLKHPNQWMDLAKLFEIDLKKPIEALSRGNRQKLGIVQAFMHEPEVLILDEPTTGLDPLMQEVFFALVHEVRSKGACVFVSSHNFAEVQRMCDRVGFLREGRLVAEQALSKLADKASHTFQITFRDEAPAGELRHLKSAKVNQHDDHHVTISLRGELTPLFALLARHHVTRFEQQEVNLEQQFLHFYKKEHA